MRPSIIKKLLRPSTDRMQSAFAIDNTLASLSLIDSLRLAYPQFSVYLGQMNTLPIDRHHFIPFGAGISTDLVTRYLSYDLNVIVAGVDCGPATANHESSEAAAIKYANVGPYENDVGHRIGNRMEYIEVGKRLYWLPPDRAWEIYNAQLEPQIILEERAKRDLLEKVPKDLALYPYYGTSLYPILLEITGQTEDVVID